MRPPDDEFREFVLRRSSALHRSAFLLCGDWHLAHDIVQEALAKSHRHWHRVERAENPDAYVHRILINETNRRWRNRGPHEVTAEIADQGSVGDATEERACRSGLLDSLFQLPPRQRATIVLRYLDGYSVQETAAVLTCSEGTVKSQTARALAALRTHLEREESLQ